MGVYNQNRDIQTYLRACVCVYVCMHAEMPVCSFPLVNTYLHTFIGIHIHTESARICHERGKCPLTQLDIAQERRVDQLLY